MLDKGISSPWGCIWNHFMLLPLMIQFANNRKIVGWANEGKEGMCCLIKSKLLFQTVKCKNIQISPLYATGIIKWWRNRSAQYKRLVCGNGPWCWCDPWAVNSDLKSWKIIFPIHLAWIWLLLQHRVTVSSTAWGKCLQFGEDSESSHDRYERTSKHTLERERMQELWVCLAQQGEDRRMPLVTICS